MIWEDNEFGTLEDDVKRRDFTVNALYCDVARKGDILDMTSGVADLQAKVVRCIGDPAVRFREDPVRMLRALKLAGIHNFVLEPDTKRALRKNLPDILLASEARLFDELVKILFTSHATSVFRLFHTSGLLQHIWPTLDNVWNTQGGRMIQKMLNLRDQCLSEDSNYFTSKGLALATATLPYVMSNLAPLLPADGSVQMTRELSNRCLESISTFFHGYALPHNYTQEMHEMFLLLLPMITAPVQGRYRLHRQYSNAYELFRLLTMATGWHTEQFRQLPFPSEDTPDVFEPDDIFIHEKGSALVSRQRRAGRSRRTK